MKVLLVQQDMGIRETEYPLFPIGLTYLAAVLRDHETRIFDPNTCPLSSAFDELKRRVKEFKPDVVGISIRNIDTCNFRNKHVHLQTVRPTVQLIKSIDLGIKVIVGGSGFSLFAELIMRKIPEIDFGVYLEGEESVPELLGNLDNPEDVRGIFIRKDGSVLFTGERPLPDFSGIPPPRMDPEIIDMRRYLGPSYNIIGVQAKRGCILKCAYCSYPLLSGRTIRQRPAAEVADQIEYMVKELGVKRFTFVDNVFNVPQQHAEDICREMIRRSIDVEFGAWCHTKGVTEEFLSLLRDAGAVQIDFSPDAATDKGLAVLNKDLTEQDIYNTIRMAKRVKGVWVGFGFFASLPGYTFKDTFKTMIMPFRIQLALPGRGGGGISYVRIEPNTVLQEIAVKEGIIDKDDNLLPEDEKQLARMFYRPRSQRLANFVMDSFIGLFERILKPGAVFFFRTLARVMRKKSVYDQKTGFVAFQRKAR